MTEISELLQGDTQHCGCQIMEYRTSLSQLTIQVTRSDNSFYLDFNGVRYFEGPMAWNDASFVCKNDDEKAEFIRSTKSLQDLPLLAIDEIFNLYVVESVGFKIVAANVFRRD